MSSGGQAYADGYIWDAGDHWLTVSVEGDVLSYFDKSISKNFVEGRGLDSLIGSIAEHLDEMQ